MPFWANSHKGSGGTWYARPRSRATVSSSQRRMLLLSAPHAVPQGFGKSCESLISWVCLLQLYGGAWLTCWSAGQSREEGRSRPRALRLLSRARSLAGRESSGLKNGSPKAREMCGSFLLPSRLVGTDLRHTAECATRSLGWQRRLCPTAAQPLSRPLRRSVAS